ncbi:hypothetical protein BSP239C_03246 [Brevibacterium sp. 239c]|nr:hypothetical protein BSP239C_03246 [Brevibacterium sp. 239c]
MKVVFQGAGAIGIAAAALFGHRHETVVVSRSVSSTRDTLPTRDTVPTRDSLPTRGAAYPRRVRSFGRGSVRRVSAIDWAVASLESWDLMVLTTRPGDLDDSVAASIVALSPPIIALTSQVDGDRDIAASMFPESEILIFSPALLSERTTGRNVRYWHPPGTPVFMASGRRETVAALRRELGGLIVGVPGVMISASPAVFIPYVAELSVREGNWAALESHLRRPTQAASEAVNAAIGIRLPMSARAARLVLDTLERCVPIDVSQYAGRHFGRHEGQTLDMLEGWIRRAARRAPTSARSEHPALREPGAVRDMAALRELAQSLRLRVTK